MAGERASGPGVGTLVAASVELALLEVGVREGLGHVAALMYAIHAAKSADVICSRNTAGVVPSKTARR
jgi:hypothetical protein